MNEETKKEADAIAPANDRSILSTKSDVVDVTNWPEPAPGRAYQIPELMCGCGARFGNRENLRAKDGTFTGECQVSCSSPNCKNRGVQLIVSLYSIPVRLATAKK